MGWGPDRIDSKANECVTRLLLSVCCSSRWDQYGGMKKIWESMCDSRLGLIFRQALERHQKHQDELKGVGRARLPLGRYIYIYS